MLDDQDRRVLIPFPQFNPQVRNSSMQIYFKNLVCDLTEAGFPATAVTPDSYASTITSNEATKACLQWVLRQAHRLGGWVCEYWLFLVIYSFWNGRPTVVAISQEYCPIMASGNSVVIVHDLIQLSYPRSRFALYYYRFITRLLRNKHIITVSQSSRENLAAFGLRSIVVYNEFTQPEESKNQAKVFDALWIGTKARHKALETYLAAARYQPNLTFAVLCPGARQLDIREPNVRTFENLSDAEVNALYTKSRVFVSTSLEEGYGRPAMEARLRGLALILSDIAVHRELHEGFADFFKPGSSLQLSQLVAKNASLTPEIFAPARDAWATAAAKFARPGELVKQVAQILSASRL